LYDWKKRKEEKITKTHTLEQDLEIRKAFSYKPFVSRRSRELANCKNSGRKNEPVYERLYSSKDAKESRNDTKAFNNQDLNINNYVTSSKHQTSVNINSKSTQQITSDKSCANM
jgi:hypothetical protein